MAETQEQLDLAKLWPHAGQQWSAMSADQRDAAVLDALTSGYSLVSVSLQLKVPLWELQLYVTGMPPEQGTLRERMKYRLAVSQAAARVQLDFTMAMLVQQSGAVGRLSAQAGLKGLTDLFGAPNLQPVDDPESDSAVESSVAVLQKHGWKLGKDFAPPPEYQYQPAQPISHADPDPHTDPHGS